MLALALGACSDFLSGPGLSNNPNVPTTATAGQLWMGSQASLIIEWEDVDKFALWAGQFSGTYRQWLDVSNYLGEPASSYYYWANTYGPGGLRDLRAIESATAAEGNFKFRGQARILEALWMGTAADFFGSVPYSDALTAAPTYDSQSAVYADVLALLDSAIVDLDRAGRGSTPTDYFYANDFTKWKALANTLRARFYMHTARTPSGSYVIAKLDSVLAAASLGIASASGEMLGVHSGDPTTALGQNQFVGLWQNLYVEPATLHIDLVTQAGEAALLSGFYVPNPLAGGVFVGTDQGIPGPQDSIATFAVVFTTPTLIVTTVENQMLLAEAKYRLGDETSALSVLNAYRASIAAAPLSLSGTGLLEAILREKYIHDFIGLESYFDYLRTCYPNFPLPVNAGVDVDYVPARSVVPEGDTNGANVPPQPPGWPGNPNDPKNSVAVDGVTTCYGQVNRVY